MTAKQAVVPLEEAQRQVALVCRRLGLLHLAFGQVLIDEFGEERGKQLVSQAIETYSRMIGEKKREMAISQGLETNLESLGRFRDIPTLGMHDHTDVIETDGERRYRAWGCVMAKTWQEYGQDELGRIYCYVDPASTMAYNPEFKFIHLKAVPDGDDYCELCVRPTTEQEREDFSRGQSDWAAVDRG